jgi:ketosteroid isomerase-like protein
MKQEKAVSTENIAVMQRFLDAVFAGDHGSLPGLLHPRFELQHSTTVPYAGVYKGAEGFLRFLGIFMSSFDPLDLRPGETYVAPSGALVVEIELSGTLKSSGKRVETTMLEKWEFENGLVRRIKPQYFDPNPVE